MKKGLARPWTRRRSRKVKTETVKNEEHDTAVVGLSAHVDWVTSVLLATRRAFERHPHHHTLSLF